MNHKRETPESRRNRLRQQESKNNPAGGFEGSGLSDLVSGLRWKASAMIISCLIGGVLLFFWLF
ncbi:DUF6366 family protein [Halobacillus sp. A5]|uniref:DUF6366 family protein n=1 Tax=Halobacillus sp. A5 TaxID=2880263 RepID=UPI0020A6A5F4|nr:DUF6366 family protein [Halobacillus sp. A5]MCP3026462.1 DUF6366 family protein [Halobacillus sp. A5]